MDGSQVLFLHEIEAHSSGKINIHLWRLLSIQSSCNFQGITFNSSSSFLCLEFPKFRETWKYIFYSFTWFKRYSSEGMTIEPRQLDLYEFTSQKRKAIPGRGNRSTAIKRKDREHGGIHIQCLIDIIEC